MIAECTQYFNTHMISPRLTSDDAYHGCSRRPVDYRGHRVACIALKFKKCVTDLFVLIFQSDYLRDINIFM